MRKKWVLLVSLLLLVSTLVSADSNAADAHRKEVAAAKQEIARRLRSQIEQREAKLKKATREESFAEIRQLRKELHVLRKSASEVKRRGYIPTLNLFKLSVGQIGIPKISGVLKVFQVIDDTRVLMVPQTTETRVSVSTLGLKATRTISAVTGEPLMFRGVSTKGLTDGQEIRELDQMFDVTGTERYRTVLGATKTVFVLQPFKVKDSRK